MRRYTALPLNEIKNLLPYIDINLQELNQRMVEGHLVLNTTEFANKFDPRFGAITNALRRDDTIGKYEWSSLIPQARCSIEFTEQGPRYSFNFDLAKFTNSDYYQSYYADKYMLYSFLNNWKPKLTYSLESQFKTLIHKLDNVTKPITKH